MDELLEQQQMVDSLAEGGIDLLDDLPDDPDELLAMLDANGGGGGGGGGGPGAATLNDLFENLLPDGSVGGVESLLKLSWSGIGVGTKIGKGPTMDWTLLHWACRRDQPDMVTMLLSHGADPQAATATDAVPKTPGMVAREYGSDLALQALEQFEQRQRQRQQEQQQSEQQQQQPCLLPLTTSSTLRLS